MSQTKTHFAFYGFKICRWEGRCFCFLLDKWGKASCIPTCEKKKISNFLRVFALNPQSNGMLFSSQILRVSLKCLGHLGEMYIDSIPQKEAVTRHSQNHGFLLPGCNIFRLLFSFFLNQTKHLGEETIFLVD